jgi:diguanylate cyclase (GGDEF)-like protein
VILDLNGFKGYNDSFGHAAGDMLLARLGASLAAAVAGHGEAYRLGGDEFCVLAACPEAEADRLSSSCARALAMHGEGFSVTAAHGAVLLPSEANDASSALTLADARMYGNKATARRSRAAAELTGVLIAVLEEHAPTLAEQSKTVRDLAVAAASDPQVTDALQRALTAASANVAERSSSSASSMDTTSPYLASMSNRLASCGAAARSATASRGTTTL